jgi:excisionase family DNA binding protein
VTNSGKSPVFTGENVRSERILAGPVSTVERRPLTPVPLKPDPLTRDDVLTATEASALLGIPRSTLYDLARRGELPARRIGRRWIFRRSLLERATLPRSEPGSWTATFGLMPAHRAQPTVGPLPAKVAREVRNT